MFLQNRNANNNFLFPSLSEIDQIKDDLDDLKDKIGDLEDILEHLPTGSSADVASGSVVGMVIKNIDTVSLKAIASGYSTENWGSRIVDENGNTIATIVYSSSSSSCSSLPNSLNAYNEKLCLDSSYILVSGNTNFGLIIKK